MVIGMKLVQRKGVDGMNAGPASGMAGSDGPTPAGPLAGEQVGRLTDEKRPAGGIPPAGLYSDRTGHFAVLAIKRGD